MICYTSIRSYLEKVRETRMQNKNMHVLMDWKVNVFDDLFHMKIHLPDRSRDSIVVSIL